MQYEAIRYRKICDILMSLLNNDIESYRETDSSVEVWLSTESHTVEAPLYLPAELETSSDEEAYAAIKAAYEAVDYRLMVEANLGH